MLQLTVNAVTAGLGYSPLQLRSMFRILEFSATPTGDHVLTTNECCLLWILMLIENLQFLSADSRRLLGESIAPACRQLGEYIENNPTSTPTLVLADNRYAIWYNSESWLDVTTGEYVTRPKPPPLETRGYHLGVLYCRNRDALAVKRKSDHASDSGT